MNLGFAEYGNLINFHFCAGAHIKFVGSITCTTFQYAIYRLETKFSKYCKNEGGSCSTDLQWNFDNIYTQISPFAVEKRVAGPKFEFYYPWHFQMKYNGFQWKWMLGVGLSWEALLFPKNVKLILFSLWLSKLLSKNCCAKKAELHLSYLTSCVKAVYGLTLLKTWVNRLLFRIKTRSIFFLVRIPWNCHHCTTFIHFVLRCRMYLFILTAKKSLVY